MELGPLLMIGLMVVVFYFLLIRPQKRRQQEQLKMQNALVPDQRVMTTSGMLATVISVEEDEVVLEIAPGVESRFVKQAIGKVLTPIEEEGGDNPGEVEDGESAEVDTVDPDIDTVDRDAEVKPDTGSESKSS